MSSLFELPESKPKKILFISVLALAGLLGVGGVTYTISELVSGDATGKKVGTTGKDLKEWHEGDPLPPPPPPPPPPPAPKEPEVIVAELDHEFRALWGVKGDISLMNEGSDWPMVDEFSEDYKAAVAAYEAKVKQLEAEKGIDKIFDADIRKAASQKALAAAHLVHPSMKDYTADAEARREELRQKYLAKDKVYFYLGHFMSFDTEKGMATFRTLRMPYLERGKDFKMGRVSGSPLFVMSDQDFPKGVKLLRKDPRFKDGDVAPEYGDKGDCRFMVKIDPAMMDKAFASLAGNSGYISAATQDGIMERAGDRVLHGESVSPQHVSDAQRNAIVKNRRDNLIMLAKGNPFRLKVERVFLYNADTDSLIGEVTF